MDTQEKITSLLESSSELDSELMKKSEAYILNVKDGGGAKFLMLWLTINKKDANIPALWNPLSSAIRVLEKSGLLSGLLGMEIVPRVFVGNDGQFVRILRLSIPISGINEFLSLPPDSLLNKTPMADSACFWYSGREKLDVA